MPHNEMSTATLEGSQRQNSNRHHLTEHNMYLRDEIISGRFENNDNS